ncbi:MAG TPA: hypothetical protein VH394_12620 [Thermoanaerobaculia bacterium]|jgi:hypothetical protein|nr:hypothetical protein [Thermoanaerobaculia bacterium]
MEPGEESRERQRLYIPARSVMRPAEPTGKTLSGREGILDGPWKSDHPWRLDSQTPDYTPETQHYVALRIGLILGIAALNFLLPSAPPLLQTLILLVDAMGVIVVFDSLNKLWYGYWNRKPTMRWTRFPALTGGRLEGVLVARPSPEVIGPVLGVLRCIQDERVESESGEVTYEPMVIYRRMAEFPVPGDRLKEVAITFDVPEDLPGTDLKRPDAVYWQVAVRIPVVGPDEELVYLAPIYNKR